MAVKRSKKAVQHVSISPYMVKSVTWRGHLKRIIAKYRRAEISLLVPRSACVSEDDRILVKGNNAWVECENGRARFLPSYVAYEERRIGDLNLGFLIKEITEEEEFESYEALTQYHYRGKVLHGRTARLIVRNYHPLYPKVVGYVELATPFYMNKVRGNILDAPFALNGIQWDCWDMETMKHYIHLIVRIARCVIYPEFRGVGLGQLLIKHAAIFARNRWQVSQLKPYFLEISADMLKFVPFARNAGMSFIGETEGNLGRVAKDMAYLLKNKDRVRAKMIVKEEACGIVDQQVSRMERAAQIMDREGWSEEDLIERLEKLSTATVLKDFDVFHNVVSLPKPTYMQGLVPQTEDFLARRLAEVRPQNGWHTPFYAANPLESPLILSSVSISYISHVRRTTQTHAIQQAFGISPEEIEHAIIRNLSLSVRPGNVILLTGPSGSGKTSLLQLLLKEGQKEITGTIQWPRNYKPAKFEPIRSRKALIEVFAERDVHKALHLMGMVGLSDAYVYLKRFEELSAGQQYRAMLAQLIASGGNVWVVDEFCTNLDPLTASLIADRLQQNARRLGVALIVASPQPEAFIKALQADIVVKLTTAWEHRTLSGAEFVASLLKRPNSFSPPELRVTDDCLNAVRNGTSTSVISRGAQSFTQNLVLLKAGRDFELVRVTGIRYSTARTLLKNGSKKQNEGLRLRNKVSIIDVELLNSHG